MGLPAMLLGAMVAANSPVPIELWKTVDTGEVNRLADAIERAFGQSAQFSLSSGQKPGTIYLSLLFVISMRAEVGDSTFISASIGIAHAPPSAPQEARGQVQCRDDDMAACGAEAVAFVTKRINQ